MSAIFDAIEANPVYLVALFFFAGYPLVTSVIWISTSLSYWLRRERREPDLAPTLTQTPPVTILVPAYNEERDIVATLEACLAVRYPDVEVVVVDDGSTDATVPLVEPYVRSGQVRLVSKLVNEGKALALNDALGCINGEIVLIVDADASPAPDILEHMVPHFVHGARVAAVTGNPRVAEKLTVLNHLQTMEFTSIVSLLRRSQRVWGRILTVSGVVTAFRVAALRDVGLFSTDMATEDIDVTWKLQKRFYDVRYEPRALALMHVPTTIGGLWRQRRRWALGLSQVIRRHAGDVFFDWRRRRMWPVAIEAVLSIVWAYLFVLLTAFWALSLAMGRPPAGASPFPNAWGMAIATMAVLQLLLGSLLDRRYERGVLTSFPFAVVYPLAYWMIMTVVTVVSTPKGLLQRRSPVARWHSVRGT